MTIPAQDTPRVSGFGDSTPRRSVIARWIMGLLLFAVVIAVILRFGELENFLELLAAVAWQWIALGLCIQAGTYLCAAGVWHQVMKYSGHPLPLRSLFPLAIAQLFARQTVPVGGISGALLVVKGLVNRGLAEADGVGCMLVGFVSFFLAHVAAVVVALVLLGSYHEISSSLLVAGTAFMLVAAGIPAGVFWLYHLGMRDRFPAWAQRLPLVARLLELLPEVPVRLLAQPGLLLKTTLLQFAVFLIDAATLTVMLHAVGYTLTPALAFSTHVMASAVGTIAPVPLGLGTYEGAGVGLLHAAGIPVEAGLAGILLLRGLTFWLPMLPGFFLTRRELSQSGRRK